MLYTTTHETPDTRHTTHQTRTPPTTTLSRGDAASPSDSERAKALRARIATVDDNTKPPVLGKDEIGAEHMAPHDVVRFVMNALKRSPEDGVTALLQFSAQTDGMEQLDFVGQLQPGAFSPEALLRYFETEPRYQALSAVSESKAMGQPELKHNAKKAVQKLLVRREGRNWEELFINLVLTEAPPPMYKRWLVASIYKQGTGE